MFVTILKILAVMALAPVTVALWYAAAATIKRSRAAAKAPEVHAKALKAYCFGNKCKNCAFFSELRPGEFPCKLVKKIPGGWDV